MKTKNIVLYFLEFGWEKPPTSGAPSTMMHLSLVESWRRLNVSVRFYHVGICQLLPLAKEYDLITRFLEVAENMRLGTRIVGKSPIDFESIVKSMHFYAKNHI
jgi:hypothetical protein